MAERSHEILDPRIVRTRQLLQDALEKLLESNDFEKITVQDIAEAATLNRATFYDHYPDKFALLECLVAARFQKLLATRGVIFDGTCASALGAIILGVCDYLAATPGIECARHRQMQPHLESAVLAVVRGMILEGLQRHPTTGDASPEMMAATLSGAIYGAANEWVRTPDRCPSETIVRKVMALLSPLLAPMPSG